MTYATVAEINSEFKSMTPALTGSDGALIESEIEAFIEQEEAFINETISNRYTVPVSGTQSIKVLKSISIAFVAYRVAKVLNLKKHIPIPDKFAPQDLNEGSAYKIAKERLKAIQNGDVVLQDAEALTTGQGISSYNSTNNISQIWKRDTKQW